MSELYTRSFGPSEHNAGMRQAAMLFVCLLASLVAAVGQAPQKAANPGLRDEALREAILERFSKSKVASEGFQVYVKGTTATITGKTDVVQRKAAATRMAKSAGARQVINKIQVSKEGRERASQGIRRARVKSAADPR